MICFNDQSKWSYCIFFTSNGAISQHNGVPYSFHRESVGGSGKDEASYDFPCLVFFDCGWNQEDVKAYVSYRPRFSFWKVEEESHGNSWLTPVLLLLEMAAEWFVHLCAWLPSTFCILLYAVIYTRPVRYYHETLCWHDHASVFCENGWTIDCANDTIRYSQWTVWYFDANDFSEISMGSPPIGATNVE